MWKKNRDDEFPVRPTPVAAVQPELTHRETMPPPPPKPAEVELPRGLASIGKSVVIKGQLLSREDLYLDGEMEGTVEVPEHRLTIGPHGRLQASVRAREVVVLGTVTGNVEASDKIDIRKDAKLVGDIKTGRIMIEDGAYFKGSIDIIREAAKAPAAPRPATPPMTTGTPAASVTPPSTLPGGPIERKF